WSEFFTWLKQRGLTGVDLVVSDHHGGLVNAIRRHFQGASWQRCQVHLMRNVLDAAPAYCQHSLKAKIRLMFNAPDIETACQRRFQTGSPAILVQSSCRLEESS